LTPSDNLVAQTVNRLLADRCTADALERAEAEGWCAPVWDGLVVAGFSHISLPEKSGGSGGTLSDAAEVLKALGRYTASVPFAETALLGGWALAQAGLPLPDGPITVVPDLLHVQADRITGCSRVAWAARARHIVAIVEAPDGLSVALIECSDIGIEPGSNLAGEARETVTFDVPLANTVQVAAPAGVDGLSLRQRGALSRVLLMAGAAEAMSELTVNYTHERHQFGQPIARFQAVQEHLVTVAQCAAQLSVAADLALKALERGPAELEIAAAKVIADDAAVSGTRAAHQAHGAMGMTREYPLHRLSRALWSWRHEYGHARSWSRQLGDLAFEAGADGLFPLITGSRNQS
jgi:acyl-CoA dehydrogenase